VLPLLEQPASATAMPMVAVTASARLNMLIRLRG
jgi:hypothetical protein